MDPAPQAVTVLCHQQNGCVLGNEYIRSRNLFLGYSLRVWSCFHMRWPKYWSFSFSIIPSKEIPGLIFTMDCLDLLAVQGTLKSFLQYHSSKASIFWHSAFMVQLSHPYMTTGKTIALIIWIQVSKVMSLLFNILSRFVIDFLPRSKHLLMFIIY